MGGASLGALNLTIISDLYAGPVRTEAMGYNASVLSVGTASYPAIGGALALLGWNYPFALSLFALGLFVAAAATTPAMLMVGASCTIASVIPVNRVISAGISRCARNSAKASTVSRSDAPSCRK